MDGEGGSFCFVLSGGWRDSLLRRLAFTFAAKERIKEAF